MLKIIYGLLCHFSIEWNANTGNIVCKLLNLRYAYANVISWVLSVIYGAIAKRNSVMCCE